MDQTLSSVEAFSQYGEDERANGEQERDTVVRGRKVLLESLARSLAIRSGLFPASAEQDSSSQRGPMCRGVFFLAKKGSNSSLFDQDTSLKVMRGIVIVI